jgi:hypothetical protein
MNVRAPLRMSSGTEFLPAGSHEQVQLGTIHGFPRPPAEDRILRCRPRREEGCIPEPLVAARVVGSLIT